MSKNAEMIRSVEELKYIAPEFEYEEYEDAYTMLLDDEQPIKYIIVGSTKPSPHYKNKRPPTKKHYIFEYVLSGKGYIFINDAWHTLEGGCMYIVGKDDARNFYSDSENPMHKLWVTFSSDYIDMMLLGFGIGSGVYKLDVAEYFKSIYNISLAPVSEKEKMLIIADNLHQIILAIARNRRDDRIQIEKRIENELASSVYSKVTLDEIASRFFMSRANLIRVFKRYKGVTPYQYLLDKKLEIARALLLTTSMSVKSISDKLCFSDEHYFSHLFTQKVGLSPLKYKAVRRGE